MPELPEVETIVSQLKKRILGKKVVKVEVLDRMVDPGIAKQAPFRVTEVYRRAKYIVMKLDTGRYLLTHLALTGHFHYLPVAQKNYETLAECSPFVVARFYLEDGSLLTHNSIRKFGFFKAVSEEQLQRTFSVLGPEPLSKDFTLEQFRETLLRKAKSRIKVLLLDQHFLAGIGNIYAQEILYAAGVNPQRTVGSLSEKEVMAIYHQIQEILQAAVKHQGSTVENYVHIEGSGGYQKYLRVYQKENCPRGHLLKKIVMGGRGTSYCPICQK